MPHWKLDDIPWHAFDRSKVEPEHLAIAKAACMVEHNGDEYARYLCEVFHGDPQFQETIVAWAKEEVQHGMALRRWVEMVDPGFDFGGSFTLFTDGHKQPVGVTESVRGSRCGELIARCVVETGTSIYYTAIKEATREPVLQAICARIAADEYRHYQLFHATLKRYQQRDSIGLLRRIAIAASRVVEIGDKELSFAFFSAHRETAMRGRDYDAEFCANHYFGYVSRMYRKEHIERMSAMVFRAIGLKPHGWINRALDSALWTFWKSRARKLARYVAEPLPDVAAEALAG
ncbi:MAG: ferritin-like domain-containing protein [Alphaproteobacteria bacterium]